jgi:beta-glucanase (GH16 family)
MMSFFLFPLGPKWRLAHAFALVCLALSACGGGEKVADSVAPTLVVSDASPGASATGAWTVLFAFSESVGTSFSAEDIALTGSISVGALEKIDEKNYSLRLTPDANSSGVLTLSVAANKFSDVALISNAQASSYSKNYNTQTVTSDWVMDWSEEFNGTQLNTNVWSFDTGSGGWGNNESQYYQASNATVKDGFLTITAKQERVGDADYTSTRIQSSRKKSFTYGRFEMRAKLPATQGMWPAFWLLGDACNSFNLYGGTVNWPDCGEIDIMEMIGGLTDRTGDYTSYGTLHYRNALNFNPAPSFSNRNAKPLSEDFHVYTMDWTPQGFTWYVDGIAFGTKLISADMAAFHKPYFMLLNLAVGGNWGGWVDSSTRFPQTFVIDYVRHYTRPWPAKNSTAGLPSSWHLASDPHLNVAGGTQTGAQPVVSLGETAISWYSPFLTGSYDAGAWTASIWTLASSGSSPVRARIYRRSATNGLETMLGETTVDPATTGSGNHVTRFTFKAVPAMVLSNESIRLELSKLSGPILKLVVNGNDFDSNLTMPWSTAGTYGAYPSAASLAFPAASASTTTDNTSTAAATLGVYADTALLSSWPGLKAPDAYARGQVQDTLLLPFEGNHSLSVNLNFDGSGWQFVGEPLDITPYAKLRFMIKTSSAPQYVRVRLAGTGQVGSVPLSAYLASTSEWQEIVIPLSAFGTAALGAVSVPFSLESVGGAASFSAQVDKVYYSKN